MSEPGLLSSANPAQQDSLWEKAPAWRSLVICASALTLVAVALPVLLPQSVDTDAQVNALAAVPIIQPQLPQSVAVSATPQVAAATPVTHAPEPTLPIVTPTAPIPVSAHAPVSTAPAVAEPASQVAPQTNVCTLVLPQSPNIIGRGVVMSFEDRATSLARIQFSQSQSGGKIDPDFIDNQRVTVQMANGNYRVLLVPKTMQVSVGDRVTMQSNYRNASLPCNYVPNLIVADLGPAVDRVSRDSPVETSH